MNIPTSSTAVPNMRQKRAVNVKPVSSQVELVSALHLRKRVFVEEMRIPTSVEFDAFDTWPPPENTMHLLVTVDRIPIATCRICTTPTSARVERMAVDRLARRRGVGRALLRHIERVPLVASCRGPLFCFAMEDKELFYRNSGWIVEEGLSVPDTAGIPHVAMLRRRRPRTAGEGENLSHVMIRTMDISRARRFYSLLGFQDVSRFTTGGIKGVWIESPYIETRLELLEVKTLVSANDPALLKSGTLSDTAPGLGHISFDVTRACTDLTRFLMTIQKDSVNRFQMGLRVLDDPTERSIGSDVVETAFITDADGTVLELMRFVRKVDENKFGENLGWKQT